jgi:hypothetical protein
MLVRYVGLCALTIAVCCALASGAEELPPGNMQAKVKAACTQCHTVANITKKNRTRAEWSKVLEKMTAYGAEVDDKDREEIIDYLTANFGPGKTATAKPQKPASSE